MPNHVLAFRTKAVESELAESANVGAAKKPFPSGIPRSVLIQSVVFHLARAVLDVFPKSARPCAYRVEIGGADERLHRGVPSGLKVIFASMPPTRLDATMQRLWWQAVWAQ